jgi:cystathionine gamma-lyase
MFINKISKKFFSTKISKIIGNDLNKIKSTPVIAPITLSTTYKINDLNSVSNMDFTYSRANNPTRKLLEDNLAILENANYGLTFSSGSAALTCVTHLLEEDEEILTCDDLYGGSKRYFNNVLKNEVNYIDFSKYTLQNIEDLFKSKTLSKIKIVFIETPTNPTMKIIPFKNLGNLCKKYNKILIVDNTFLTPIFQNPLDYNADIVLHSCSKYLGGHSDIIMGALMMNNKKLYNKLKYLQNSLGLNPSPFDCFMLNRSIKTLEIRMIKHQTNAIYISKKLVEHPKIFKVLYPGLDKKNIPCHMKGHGGIISFYIKGTHYDYNKFIKNLKKIPLAESLGGIESLINHPRSMTHASVDKDELYDLGITDNFFRLSVGIEDKKYIWNDIKNALDSI